MIQKEKLVQFYFSQYRDSAMALKKKNNDGKKTYEQRIGRLITEMQRTKTGKLTQPHLEEYHRQIRNMAYYALKQKNQYAIMQIRDILMPELVRLDIGTLREEEQELVTSRLLEYLRTERPGEICQHPMRSILKNLRKTESVPRSLIWFRRGRKWNSARAGNEAAFYFACRTDKLR